MKQQALGRDLVNDLLNTLDPLLFAKELGFRPDGWQEKVLTSSSKRIILNCARQTGKSTVTAIMALHRALYWPGSLILLISPSLRQSSELFRMVNNFLHILHERPHLLEDNKLSCTLTNKSRIVSLPSKEATIRGFSGANLIIEDESSRVLDDLYVAIRPMLSVSGGKLVLMSTPFGKRGHFWQEWTSSVPGWERIQVKATECARISPQFLEEERASLGDWWYRQEYDCQFVAATDSVFNFDLILKSLSDDIAPLFEDEEAQKIRILNSEEKNERIPKQISK
ncbi:terminase family protein [Desulfobacterota bacterium AH_259_B03_O07]|nr:terminase family protein [Desulfobacterota bacterium AH_259_B03_O07]